MRVLWELFLSFAKVGAFTFGGGYAMLPIIQKEAVERRGWLRDEEVADYFAVAQCLPGIISVNTATFIGHQVKGKAGSAAACLGLVMPSFVFITLIAATLQNFLQYPLVQRALFGVQIVVCALIAQAVITMWKAAVKDLFGLGVYLVTLALALFASHIPIAALVVAAVGAGIAADALKSGRTGEGER